MQYRLDHPGYDCRVCQALADDGEPIEIPCDGCPQKILGEPDEPTLLALDVWDMLTQPIWSPETPPPFEFLFRLAGIRRRALARAVYERLSVMMRLYREYHEHDAEHVNGQPGSRKEH